MADQEDMSRAEELAKRALDLAARAEELARQAHEVVGVDEQLASLEAELDGLAAEEDRLDADIDGGGDEASEEPRWSDWVDWADTVSQRMEALGDRIGDLISGGGGGISGPVAGVGGGHGHGAGGEAAFGPPFTPTRSRRAPNRAPVESKLAVAGPLPVQVQNNGGGIQVRAGHDGQVLVRARARNWFGWWSSQSRQPMVSIEERDGTVFVESSQWGFLQLDVEVPAGSATEVMTGGGSVGIWGTGAPVRVETGGGGVTVDGADGPVIVMTGGGRVRVDGRLQGDSRVSTGGGAVTVILRPGSRVDVEAQGTSTSTDVEGLRAQGYLITGSVEGGGDGRLHVETGGGGVRITHA